MTDACTIHFIRSARRSMFHNRHTKGEGGISPPLLPKLSRMDEPLAYILHYMKSSSHPGFIKLARHQVWLK